jgi:hypothetical protein
MGKSTISMAMFNSYVCLPEGMCIYIYIYTSHLGENKRWTCQKNPRQDGNGFKNYIYIFYLILSGSGWL